jgi:hypothetical protein
VAVKHVLLNRRLAREVAELVCGMIETSAAAHVRYRHWAENWAGTPMAAGSAFRASNVSGRRDDRHFVSEFWRLQWTYYSKVKER